MKANQFVLSAVVVTLLAATHAAGAPLCKPQLAIKEVMFSPMHQGQRTWTAQIDVDASPCATASGRFAVNFVRLKEIGPDLLFTEQFTWTPGAIKASTDFAADEAVADYTITAAACPCR
jgi:hypothetical protein